MSEQAFQSSFNFVDGEVATFSDELVVPLGVGDEGLPKGEKSEGYGVYIFMKDMPHSHNLRCYQISYQPSLWDSYTVQRQWGMVGSERQQFHTEHFRSARPALACIRRLVDCRLRRGYRLSYAA